MNDPSDTGLCPADQQALDALLAAGFDVSKVPAEHRDRARCLGRLLGLLETLPAEEPGDLVVQRTLEAVARARQTQRAAAAPPPAGGENERALPFRWPDMAAVAAMVLIALSLALPMLNHSQEQARQLACQANLATAGMGFGRYAAAHDGALPAVAAHSGHTWWDTNTFNQDGSTRSNSAHYFLLIRTGYASPRQLTCAAQEHGTTLVRISRDARDWPNRQAIPFSYANLFAQQKPTWDGPRRVILVDRNPLFVTDKGMVASVDPQAISPRHAALGVQNVLFSDGNVAAIDRPVLDNGDNIWQLKGHDGVYTGTETPDDQSDTFVVP